MDRIETAPQMEWAIQERAHGVEAWRDSHALSRPLVQRREQREAAHTALQGLRAAVPRTACG